MIIFIHGDNQEQSRNKLIEIIKEAKNNTFEIIELNGLNIDLNNIIQSLESSSLFGQKKLVVIENLFSRLASKTKEEMVKYLKANKINCDLILWERKEISGTTLRWLSKEWQYLLFKTPVIIFTLLDSFKPANQQNIISLLAQAKKSQPLELIFYLLIRRVKELIIAKDLNGKGLKAAPWQIGKLISQAKNFTLDKLVQIYQQLLIIDTQIKTGTSLMPLDWQLDLLIINL